MDSHYHIDLNNYSLKKYSNSLSKRKLIPSRKILKVGLKKNIAILEEEGIKTLGDLVMRFNKKEKIQAFAQKVSIPEDYLTILVREAKSYLPNPISLSKLPDIDKNYIEALAIAGIKNTKQLFTKALNQNKNDLLSKELNIPQSVIKELIAISDLSRLYGVGPVFARMLYDIGIISVHLFMKNSADEIVAIYENHTGKKADFSVDDILFSQEIARELPDITQSSISKK